MKRKNIVTLFCIAVLFTSCQKDTEFKGKRIDFPQSNPKLKDVM